MEIGVTQTNNDLASQIFFNVSQAVGQGKSNLTEDVLLVQYFFRRMAASNVPTGPPELNAKMAAVQVTGVFDDLTKAAILEFQKRAGWTVDGIISPGKGGSYGYGVYTIWNMNSVVRGTIRNIWPRIQDLPDCPGVVKAKAQAIV